VWFPGGIVIGGLTAFAIDNLGIGGEANGWKLQMASMLIPLAIYGAMFMGKKFPQTERAASNSLDRADVPRVPAPVLFALRVLHVAHRRNRTRDRPVDARHSAPSRPGISAFCIW
jgi:hypothetical protein